MKLSTGAVDRARGCQLVVECLSRYLPGIVGGLGRRMDEAAQFARRLTAGMMRVAETKILLDRLPWESHRTTVVRLPVGILVERLMPLLGHCRTGHQQDWQDGNERADPCYRQGYESINVVASSPYDRVICTAKPATRQGCIDRASRNRNIPADEASNHSSDDSR